MQVRDIMTREVRSCGPDSAATAAAQIMWERDVGAVPVIDSQGRPIAMVTDRDLSMALYTRGGSLADLSVSSAMSKTVFTCRDRDGVGIAERLMMEHQVRRLPVVDDTNRLVGVLSLNDIALARTKSAGQKITERVLGDVSETLAAICRHRTPAQQASV